MDVGTFLELSKHVVKLKIAFRVLKVNLREHSGRKNTMENHTKIKGKNIRKAETQNNCLFSIYLAQIPEKKKTRKGSNYQRNGPRKLPVRELHQFVH